MSRASMTTLLSLDRWAAILGLNPWHFCQATTAAWPANDCDDVMFQWSWHDASKVGREDVARAIAEAEADIAQALGFWPAPRYQADEAHAYPRHHARELVNVNMRQRRGDRKSVTTDWGLISCLGVEQKSLILAAANVVLGADTASLVAATTVTDPAEIAVYHRVTEGADAAASEVYRIRGGHKALTVSIAAGVVTISGPKYLFLSPSLQDAAAPLDGDAAASYVQAVDVYRRRCDPSDEGALVWNGNTGCDATAAACAETTQALCGWLRDARAGVIAVRPALWDATTLQYDEADMTLNYDPDQVRLNYLAGEALGADGEMVDYWAQAVAYYAAALLDRPLCACDLVNARIARWQEDLAQNTEKGKSYQNHDIILSSPFGTRRGAIFAWQRVRERALGHGLAM